MLKIVIIGAGAFGKCFAALLADQAAIVMHERNPMTFRALKKGYFIFKEEKRESSYGRLTDRVARRKDQCFNFCD